MSSFRCSGLRSKRNVYAIISENDSLTEFLVCLLALHTLGQLRRHTGIHLDCRHMFCFLEDPDSKISRPWTYLKHFVCRTQI